MPDDGTFEHRFMLQQAVFDLDRRDVNARHFEHVVGAAVIPVVALAVHVKLVAGGAPVAREGLLRFLVRVPVAQRRRVSLDAQRAHLAGGHRAAFPVNDLRLVAFDDPSKTARTDISGAIRNVNMKHLGRADAVENLDIERLDPPLVELDGQRLARRQAHSQGR
jgi:hypothetical protein